jgi:GNAT superfamily N-acetyltransferase
MTTMCCYRPPMDRTTLARLEHENMVEAIAAAGAQVGGGRVERGGGIALVATGLPLRLFNQVIVEGDDTRSDAIVEAVAVMRGRGDRFVVNLRRGADDRHVPLMDELGLVPLSGDPWMPGMALHPIRPAGAASLGPGHEIRRIADEAGIRDHVITAAAGFEMPEAWIAAIVTKTLVDQANAALYVGYADGAPVTTGLGIRTDRTIGVYNIATAPSARRHGYGAAMTMRVVADGAAAGCDVAILQATAMGRPVYERLGFRTVVEYIGYVDPGSLQPTPGAEGP